MENNWYIANSVQHVLDYVVFVVMTLGFFINLVVYLLGVEERVFHTDVEFWFALIILFDKLRFIFAKLVDSF